jgi:homoserine kinase
VFGCFQHPAAAAAAAVAMRAAFAEAGLDSDAFVAPIDGPAAALVDDEVEA